MNRNEYLLHVWKCAEKDAEDEVMRYVASLPGGKRPGDSVEAHAARVRASQDRALEKLKIARSFVAQYEKGDKP